MADPRLDQLSPAKRALLRRLLAEQKAALPRIASHPSDSPAPLSAAQQRLWFLDQLEPGNSFYNVSVVVDVSGDLDADRLEQAIQQLIARHTSFRTHFQSTEGIPFQLVEPEVSWQLARHDVTHLALPEQATYCRELARALATQPFDLTHAPLFRFALARHEKYRHTLVFVMHHIVCDGWSLNIAMRELLELYHAIGESRPPSLADLSIHYADYARWQCNIATDATHPSHRDLAKHLAYWQERLGHDPTPLEIPTDRPRPASPTYATASVRALLPPDVLSSFGELANQERASLFMVLLTAWHLILSRYTGESRIRVGAPIANRHPAETEPLIGMFVNTLALQTEIDWANTFRGQLRISRDATLDAMAHQDVPFDHLVETLQPQRDPGRSPIVQHLFVMQEFTGVAPVLNETTASDTNRLSVNSIDLSFNPTAAYDLTLNLTPHADCMELLLVYNTDLYDESTATRILSNYQTVLHAVAHEPDLPLPDVPYLAPAELQRIVCDWNQTENNDYKSEPPVHELVRRAAHQYPDAVAVILGSTQVTYRELQTRAGVLAQRLIAFGVIKGDRVGICLPRSPEAIIAMLAILQTGAAFVPIDPEYPKPRVEFLIQDANLRAIITNDATRQLHPLTDCVLVGTAQDIAAVSNNIAEQPLEVTPVTHDDIAYLIYTSGSTGTPKAAEIRHSGWVNHALMMARRQRIAHGDRRLQCLSLSFDASLEEIFPALISGATLVMHPQPRELSLDEMRRFCSQHEIRHFNLLPALFEPIVSGLSDMDHAWVDQLKSVIIGGDRISPEIMRRWIAFAPPHTHTLFVYGVTEATIANTIYHVPHTFDAAHTVPIGTPLDNQRVYVLDDRQQLVPIGAVGELWIGGIGVARGYFQREQLTAERFVVEPFGDEPNQYLYRTGDLVRWRADGNLEFAGRADHQIKIRGYRIETGEIESALLQDDNISEAKVIARTDQRNHRQLVAYVVPTDAKRSLDIDSVRNSLQALLPAHMIPAAFVTLQRFPLAPGNKIDFRALPQPDWTSHTSAQHVTKPITEVERRWVAVWEKVLNTSPIGTDDNFFALGGDSILTLRLVSEAAAAGFQITPKQVFLHQTIAEISRVATGRSNASTDTYVGFAHLTPIQRQFFATSWHNPHRFTQSLALYVTADVTAHMLDAAWKQVVLQHPAWMSHFASEDDVVHQVFRKAPEAPQLGIHPTQTSGDQSAHRWDIERLIEEQQARLDISCGPVVAADCYEIDPSSERLLIISAHHLVVDAVSWHTVIDQLHDACDRLRDQQELRTTAASSHVASWSATLHGAASSFAVQRHRPKWLRWPPSPMARDATSSATTLAGSAKHIAFSLDAVRTDRLLYRAVHRYRTKVDEFLLAAWCKSLADWYSTQQVRVDVELHGREAWFAHDDLSQTVGWLTAAVPVQLTLPESNDPHDIVPSVKDQMRQFTRFGVAFGALRWLTDDPEMQREFRDGFGSQISFNYLGRLDYPDRTGSIFKLATDQLETSVDPRNPRWHMLDLIGLVRRDQLQLQLTYHPDIHQIDRVTQLIEQFTETLTDYIESLSEAHISSATPSDYPCADLNARELATVLARIQRQQSARSSA